MPYDPNAKPIEIEKTCTWCNGTGKAGNNQSLYEILTGGLCSRCHGTGKEKELQWVSQPNQYTTSTYQDTQNNSDDFLSGIIFIAVVVGKLLGYYLATTYPDSELNSTHTILFGITGCLGSIMGCGVLGCIVIILISYI